MKLDFSDIPILLAFFILGPLGGLQVAFLRSLLYFMISGPSLPQLIGVSLSFVAKFHCKGKKKQNDFSGVIFCMLFA